jgi:hypothetical protein
MLSYILLASLLASGIATIPYLEKRVQSNTTTVNIDWETVLTTLETTTTLQVVANPMLLRNSSIHDNALISLESVAANYVRFVPWYPYPKLAVPEIDAPVINGNECTASWDFTYADPLMEDFFSSTPNVSHIINFSTSPGWMWVLPSGTTYTYPDDINDTDFNYNQGTQLRDPSLKEISDYYSRLVSWYVKGGFTDECGVYHHSGHSYEIGYWEVLNEVDVEHNINQPYYNQIYDAIVTAIREVSPNTKFVGLALALEQNLTYFEEFLDPSKHEAAIIGMDRRTKRRRKQKLHNAFSRPIHFSAKSRRLRASGNNYLHQHRRPWMKSGLLIQKALPRLIQVMKNHRSISSGVAASLRMCFLELRPWE